MGKIVKCPDGIIKYHNKKDGSVKVYITAEKKYDKDKKYNVNKRKYIGKMVDEEYIDANDAFFEFFPELYPLEEPPKKSGSLQIGLFVIVAYLFSKLKINDCLDKIYGKDAEIFKDLATYLLVSENNVIQHFSNYEYNHPQFNDKSVSDSYVSELFQSIPISTHEEFLDAWNELQPKDEKIYISFDTTNSGTSSKGIDLAEIGHAKIDNGLPIVNTGSGYSDERGLPLFYEDYPGSIIDNTVFSSIVERCYRYEYRNIGFMLDRGFFSKSNIKFMDEHGYDFILMVKGNAAFLRGVVEEARDTFDKESKYFIANKNLYGMTFKKKLYDDDTKDRYIHVYWDKKRASEEEFRVLNEITSCEEDLKKMINLKQVESRIIKKCQQYFKLEFNETNDGIISFTRDEDSIQNILRKCGCFSIVTSEEMTAVEALYKYRHRDAVEKLFAVSKTFLGEDVFRVHTTESLHSKQQVIFIAEILRAEIFNNLETLKEKDRKNFTVPAVLKEMENIEIIQDNKGTYRLRFALTKKQKNILNCFDIDENEFIEFANKLCKKYS